MFRLSQYSVSTSACAAGRTDFRAIFISCKISLLSPSTYSLSLFLMRARGRAASASTYIVGSIVVEPFDGHFGMGCTEITQCRLYLSGLLAHVFIEQRLNFFFVRVKHGCPMVFHPRLIRQFVHIPPHSSLRNLQLFGNHRIRHRTHRMARFQNLYCSPIPLRSIRLAIAAIGCATLADTPLCLYYWRQHRYAVTAGHAPLSVANTHRLSFLCYDTKVSPVGGDLEGDNQRRDQICAHIHKH